MFFLLISSCYTAQRELKGGYLRTYMKGEVYIACSLTTKITLWGSLGQAEGVHWSLVKPAPSNSSTTA